MLVDPQEPAIAGRVLQQAHHGHHDRGQRQPAHPAFDVFDPVSPLDDQEKQHHIGQIHHQTAARVRRHQRHARPNAGAGTQDALRHPGWQQLGERWRHSADPGRRQRQQLQQDQHQSATEQQFRPSEPPPIRLRSALLGGPGHRRSRNDRDQDQPSQRMAPAHEPGSQEHHRHQPQIGQTPQPTPSRS